MKTLAARFALLLLTACAGTAPAAGPGGPIHLDITPDHADGSYSTGDTVAWEIRLSGLPAGGTPPTPTYTVSRGAEELAQGTLAFADGRAMVTCKAEQPGVLVLQVNEKTPGRPNVRCGAAVDWRKITSTVVEPADFDEFWKEKLEELAAVPMNPVLEEIVMKVLSKERSARYRTADQLGRVLQKFGMTASQPLPR